MKNSFSGWRSTADLIALLAATIGLHIAFALQTGAIASNSLIDTDGFMRLLRIEELWQTGDWYNTYTSSLGAPGKLSLHWTRPLDILILLPAILLHALGLAMDRAIYWSGVAISPILHFLAAVSAARTARLLWPQHGAWRIAALMVLLNGSAMTYCMPARPDHHSLGLLLTALSLGLAVRATMNARDSKSALKAGAWSGVGVWVSPEALVAIAPVLIAFGLLWVIQRDAAQWAAQARRYCIGMAIVILFAITLEQPPARWFHAEYDKVSILYLALAVAAAIDFWLAEKMPWGAIGRLLAGGGVAVLSAGILALLFPGFYLGPLGNISTSEAKVFLNDIREMSPIWPVNHVTTDQFAGMIGNSLAALPVIPYCLRRWRGSPLWPTGLMLAVSFAVTLVAGLQHQRIALFLCPVGAVLGSGLLAILCDLAKNRMRVTQLIARWGGAFIVAFGIEIWPLISGGDTTASASNAACNPVPVGEWLNAAHPGIDAMPPRGSERTTPIIMTESINYPPELAYRTGYRFVGGPYHRGMTDVEDMYEVAIATDDAAVRGVLTKRHVSYYLMCIIEVPKPIGQSPANSLYHRLLRGEVPGWLTPVPMSDDASREFRLFAVNP